MAVGDILGIGASGLLAYQRALATIGHNITNVNTEGYSRQRVDLVTQPPEYTGAGYLGAGVKVDGVHRLFDQFLHNQVRTSTSSFSQLDHYYSLASQIDNLLANPQAGLSPALQGLFNAVQDVADDPTSITARQVMLSEAGTLTTRFHYINNRIEDLRHDINTDLGNQIDEINGIAASIARLNKDIILAKGDLASNPPNDLLDQRDLLITKLAEKIDVTTLAQDDGSINVFVGNGQSLVVGLSSFNMSVVRSYFDPSRYEVAIGNSATSSIISDQISGGLVGGILQFREQVLDEGQSMLGLVATGLAEMFNQQHRLGVDLLGAMGQDFFLETTPVSLSHSNNTTQNNVNMSIIDSGQLTGAEYLLRYDGAAWSLMNQKTGQAVSMTGTGTNVDPFLVEGLSISVEGVGAVPGDDYSFWLRPTIKAAGDIDTLIADANKVAAASVLRTTSVLANTGTATLDSATLTDPTSYIPDTYTVVLGDDSNALADGVTRGVMSDVGINNNLQYELWINGTLVYTQNEAAAPLPDLASLAANINDDLATTGVRAYVDAVNNKLYLVNEPATALPVNVTETLTDTLGAALDPGDGVTGYFGAVLTGAAPSSSQQFTRAADSYIVVDGAGNTVTSGAYASGATLTFNGISATVSGTANLGDQFIIQHNTSGVSDNRNALALAGLQTSLTMLNGTANFQGVYGQLVADVGVKTHQAQTNRDVQNVLLRQANEYYQSVSGVNLDEEAANMVRFQQAYQAAAQVINASNVMFDSLIAAIRG